MAIGSALNRKKQGDVPEEIAAPAAVAETDTAALPAIPPEPQPETQPQPSALPAAGPDDAWSRAWAAAPPGGPAAPPLLPAPGAVVAVLPLSARAPRSGTPPQATAEEDVVQNRSGGDAARDQDDGPEGGAESSQDAPVRPLRRSAAAARSAAGAQKKQRGRTPKASGGGGGRGRSNSAAASGRSAGTPEGSAGSPGSGSSGKQTGSSRRGGATTEVSPLATTVPQVSPAELPATFSAPVRTLPGAAVEAGAGVAAARGAVTALVQPVRAVDDGERTTDVPPSAPVLPLRPGIPAPAAEPSAPAPDAGHPIVGGSPSASGPTAVPTTPVGVYSASGPVPDAGLAVGGDSSAPPGAPARTDARPARVSKAGTAPRRRPLGTLPAGPDAAAPSGMAQLGLVPADFTAVPPTPPPGPATAPAAAGPAAVPGLPDPGLRPAGFAGTELPDPGAADLGLRPAGLAGTAAPGAGGVPDGEAAGMAAGAVPGAQAGITLSARLMAAAAAPPMPTQPPLVGAGADGTEDPGDPLPTPEEITLLRRSLMAVEPVADRATAHFYAVLFLHRPELRALFPAAMDVQRDRLFRALLAAARTADDIPALSQYLTGLAVVHRKFGVRDEHYPPVGSALLAALERYCGSRWDEPTRRAWTKVYALISQVMIQAAAEDAQHAPAWWQGEVVAIDRRTADVAVVTVRTDHPYPFRAGQHAQLEVPWWPRVWRHYSIANAPHPAGVLSFHVKAVPAGWVSNALVHHAQPGVRVRLGPPQGGMTVDHDSADPLLLVGGGTGIAPMLALVQEVAAHGGTRKVELFYGARRPRDLYAAPQLVELTRRHPWLSVRTCVSESGVQGGPHADAIGRLPEVVAGYGPWEGYRAWVAGPPAMIRRTVTALGQAGLPAELIRHDLADLPDEPAVLRVRGRR